MSWPWKFIELKEQVRHDWKGCLEQAKALLRKHFKKVTERNVPLPFQTDRDGSVFYL